MDYFQDQSSITQTRGIFTTSTLLQILSTIVVILYLASKSLNSIFQRLYFVPPNDFRDVIQVATESNSGLLKSSRVGIKTASLRRRLIMGSISPQSYSTLPLNTTTNDNTVVDNTDRKFYRLRVNKKDRENKESFLKNIKPLEPSDFRRKKLFGFFHPFSYASGGGEKVLWEAVISTLEADKNNVAVIYTFTDGKDFSVFSILERVNKTFGINFFTDARSDMRKRIVFIHLPDKYQWLIKGESYKFLSIVGQAIGSIILLFIGLNQLVPDIYIDTIGLPFTYSIVHLLLGLPIISYVHYPTVSRDMLKSASLMPGIRGILKYYYWLVLLKLYAFNLVWSDITLFNSTWTAENVQAALGLELVNKEEEDHIRSHILYPPCVCYDDTNFDQINVPSLISKKRKRCITYVAQFRPEKRHDLLIRHYKEYLNKLNGTEPYSLILIGSLRSANDEELVNKLKELIKNLNIPESHISFIFNASNDEVDRWLLDAEFGINCMWKEHFGIAVVEYMLHGEIPLVHASAGPLEDIVVPRIKDKAASYKGATRSVKNNPEERTGLFFKDKNDPDYDGSAVSYPTLSEMLLMATSLSDSEKQVMRTNCLFNAREKFGRGVFSSKWKEYVYEISTIEEKVRSKRGEVERVY